MATWWDIVSGASTYSDLKNPFHVHPDCNVLSILPISVGISLTYAAQADAAAQTTWSSNDRQAQSLISVFIHQDMQHLQKDAYVVAGDIACPSLAKDLWDQLAALYAPTGITSQYEAFSQALGIWIIDLSDRSNCH